MPSNSDGCTGAGRVPSLERLLQDGLANILFVGRIAPNKKIEDHIRLAEHYKRYVDAYYRFIFVGTYDARAALLRRRSGRSSPSTRCCRSASGSPGPVPDAELAAYYRNAHAYVSLSEHEGFCVPLVEAMAMDVPVLAYARPRCPRRSAAPALSFAPKDLEQAAELLGALVYDEPLRQQVLAGQRRAADGVQSRPLRSRGFVTCSPRSPPDPHENCFHRSTLRHGDPRRIRVSTAAWSPSGSPSATRSTCSRRARATTSRGRTNTPRARTGIRGVTVRRFANARTRDLEAFNKYSDWIFHHAHSRQEEMEWLKQQGPWSPGLIEYLERHHQHYDVLIFFTYLYAPTVLGLRVAPSKSLLVPTAHDEPAIRLGIYQDVFGSAAGIVWNTEAERRFVTVAVPSAHARRGRRGLRRGSARGRGRARRRRGRAAPGADGPRSRSRRISRAPANAFRRRHRMHGPFLLYGGRIDPGKGCEELLEYFQTYVKDGGDATLMLMGVKLMPLPDDPHVRFAGMLPDEERLHALEAATVVVVPSPYESLSLLALEAFAVGTPVLANARAEVLVDHCRRSNAGLYYADRWEFEEGLKLLLQRRRAPESDGAQRQGLHQPELPLEHRPQQVRADVRSAARSSGADAGTARASA